jgi:hypothetical protein
MGLNLAPSSYTDWGMPMYVFGRIRNGVVVLDQGETLPEGSLVRVEPVEPTTPELSLSAQLLQWAGQGVDLPADLARRHDDHRHGKDDS